MGIVEAIFGCNHDWKEESSHESTEYRDTDSFGAAGYPVTTITYRCTKCGQTYERKY